MKRRIGRLADTKIDTGKLAAVIKHAKRVYGSGPSRSVVRGQDRGGDGRTLRREPRRSDGEQKGAAWRSGRRCGWVDAALDANIGGRKGQRVR